MPKNDPSKAAYTESLATRTPIKANNIPTATYRTTQAALPPPHRTTPLTSSLSLGKARALYDYDGAEEEDLAVREGEVVIVVEHGQFLSGDTWMFVFSRPRKS